MGFKYLTYFQKGYIQWTGIPCEIQRPNDLFSLAGSHRLPLYPLTIYFWSRPLELTCNHHFPSIDSGEINSICKVMEWRMKRLLQTCNFTPHLTPTSSHTHAHEPRISAGYELSRNGMLPMPELSRLCSPSWRVAQSWWVRVVYPLGRT